MQQTLFSLQFVHAAIVAGPIFFLAVSFFIGGVKEQSESSISGIVLAVSVFSIPLVFFLRKILPKTSKEKSLEENLGNYRTLKIVTAAIVEGGALLNCVLFFITGSFLSLGGAILLTIVNLFQFPRLSEFTELYGIDKR
ncbi:hypothetical protein LEP1GSC047_3166 [Leptospira inadai serovar Lyme str. 10]|uniref:Uncharacterized protein n=2 Tax=Leptospira inadai serovar Lyme TaxID=293084 RepID=V6HC79_9LEPT|nr:hypothetical protein [Leptospira inadai]EQA36393.1 hypothetical protein LEP1GSC047_3166 [Leptospira inadai serovar Lyme str. 10]PNV71793.1 hypothetical protein BES34_020750 [Leptospira inadai serovar Lyme]